MMKKNDEIIVAPKEKKATEHPKAGCRLMTLVYARPTFTRYGEPRVHVEFDYKGFTFGQFFELDGKDFKKIFPDGIKQSDIGKKMFVEVEIDYGKISGKPYAKVVGKENA